MEYLLLFFCFGYIEMQVVMCAPFREVCDSVAVIRYRVIVRQKVLGRAGSVVSVFEVGGGVGGAGAVISVQGVKERAEHRALRGSGVGGE